MTHRGFLHIGRKKIEMSSQTGVVIEYQQRDELSISGSGSTTTSHGHIHGYSRVDSNNTNYQTLFLKDVETGLEREFKMWNSEMGIRPGHMFSNIKCASKMANATTHIFNHNTNKLEAFEANVDKFVRSPALITYWVMFSVFIVGVWLVATELTNLGAHPFLGERIFQMLGILLLSAVLMKPLLKRKRLKRFTDEVTKIVHTDLMRIEMAPDETPA